MNKIMKLDIVKYLLNKNNKQQIWLAGNLDCAEIGKVPRTLQI